jgi:glycerol-3-phosphate O-acyltransferase
MINIQVHPFKSKKIIKKNKNDIILFLTEANFLKGLLSREQCFVDNLKSIQKKINNKNDDSKKIIFIIYDIKGKKLKDKSLTINVEDFLTYDTRDLIELKSKITIESKIPLLGIKKSFYFFYTLKEKIIRKELVEKLTSAGHSSSKSEGYINSILTKRSLIGCFTSFKIVDIVFKRMFKEINFTSIEPLEELEKKYFVVYCSSHRSYLDSGILYHQLVKNSSRIPYIVAADKMRSNWLGRIGSHSGVFFIKRKKVDELYNKVIKLHLKQIEETGATFEVFVEGQRSRSGLTLPPKTGICKSILANLREHQGRPVAFVPVSFGYDKLPESENLTKEILNDRKEKGILSLKEKSDIKIKNFSKNKMSKYQKIKSTIRKISSPPVSRCHIVTGKPIIIKSSDINESIEKITQESLSAVMFEINSNTPIFVSSVVCTAVLSSTENHLDRNTIKEFIQFSNDLFNINNFNINIKESIEGEIDKTLKLPFINRKFKKVGLKEDQIVSISDLDFTRTLHYKNNILHFYILPSLLSQVLISTKKGKIVVLNRHLSVSFEKMINKFFLPKNINVSDFIDKCLQLYQKYGLISLSEKTYSITPQSDLNSDSILRITANIFNEYLGENLEELQDISRKFERFKFSSPVSIKSKLLNLDAQLLDISYTGARINISSGSLEKSDIVQFQLPLNVGSFEVEAKVLNIYSKNCYGLKFLNLDPIKRFEIDKLYV